MQITEQLSQRNLLCIGTGIAGSLAVTGKPSHIRYADGVPVMVLAVRPNHFFRSSRLDSPVRRNYVVVAAAHPTERTVIAVDIRHPKGTARPIGGAVHNNKSNGTHRLKADWRPHP